MKEVSSLVDFFVVLFWVWVYSLRLHIIYQGSVADICMDFEKEVLYYCYRYAKSYTKYPKNVNLQQRQFHL